MDRADVERAILKAVAELIEHQPELLKLDVNERSLSHHLAIYLAVSFPNHHVDVEYNRDGADPKRLNLPPRRSSDEDTKAVTVYPDIIVHKRDCPDHNLLVIELKKPGEPLGYDEQKLQAFRQQLNYEHAVHLVLGTDVGGEPVHHVKWSDA